MPQTKKSTVSQDLRHPRADAGSRPSRRVHNKSTQSQAKHRKKSKQKSKTYFSGAELKNLADLRAEWIRERQTPLVAVDGRKHTGPPEARHLVERHAVDDRLFSEIARLTQISAPISLARLQHCISYELDKAWIDFRHKSDPIDPVEGKTALRQLQSLKTKGTDFLQILGSLSGVALMPVRIALSERWDVLLTTDQVQQVLSLFGQMTERLIARTLFFATVGPEPIERGVGRPQGGILTERWNPFLRFVLNILWDIEDLGGRLTLDKNQREGSLLEALESLRFYMPPGFLPKPLPVRTMARIKAGAGKVARGEIDASTHAGISK